MSEVVRLEVADGIGTIVLDRPKMNALDAEMQRQLVAVVQRQNRHLPHHLVAGVAEQGLRAGGK